MSINEITYWVTLASMPGMWTRRKNQLYVACYKHQPQYSIIDLFENRDVRLESGVTQDEELLFIAAHEQLANNAFMVEDLLNQGYDIIPLTSPYYPRALMKSLKYGAPCVLYVKGDKSLLNRQSIAIVGSRKADSISLEFTTNIAKKATQENKTVVSGFAKGVDRQALDATIEALGTSIIVLPQGITTFASGFRQYYQPICTGRVAVISVYHPKAPWSVERAMARNSIIYGLADEIYAAQSDTKGGTWSGVIEGLKKGQTIYVRVPLYDEKNANNLLIQKGGVGVDLYGNVVSNPFADSADKHSLSICIEPNDTELNPTTDTAAENDVKKRVLDLLVDKKKSRDILMALKIDWSDSRMKRFLRSIPEIDEETIAGKVFFFKKGFKERTLFEV